MSHTPTSLDSLQVFSVLVGEPVDWGLGQLGELGKAERGGWAVTPASPPQMSLPCSSEGMCFSPSGGSSR